MKSPGEIDWDGDYVGLEDHRPSYYRYVHNLTRFPDKPVLSEDQFRVRDVPKYAFKDYNDDLTRRGLWHSTMAGGVGNLWADMSCHGEGKDESENYVLHRLGGCKYSEKGQKWIKTHSELLRNHFPGNLVRANELTDFEEGSDRIDEVANLNCCLRSIDNQRFIFYKENCDSIRMNLSSMAGPHSVIAIDTRSEYREIYIGSLDPKDQTWSVPYMSDWVIVIED